jgi:hypothetical protein
MQNLLEGRFSPIDATSENWGKKKGGKKEERMVGTGK